MLEAVLMHRPDPTAAALELVKETMQAAVSARGVFHFVLSGGSTPLPLYRALAVERKLPWAATHVFLADERFVPYDHERSNARAIRDVLFTGTAPTAARFHPWPILGTPGESAAAYASELTSLLGTEPVFDLTLLGLGADGHTASLFPGTAAASRPGLTVPSTPPGQPEARLSLTAEALSRSRTTLFLVTGESKRAALEALVGAQGDLDECPARAVGALERRLVLTDLDL